MINNNLLFLGFLTPFLLVIAFSQDCIFFCRRPFALPSRRQRAVEHWRCQQEIPRVPRAPLAFWPVPFPLFPLVFWWESGWGFCVWD
uniref:Secreted protein n=1 Tax=Arundo donax TaxID=35708 RepID=A0A0A9DJY8_ARUDO